MELKCRKSSVLDLEGTALGQLALSTCGFGENVLAVVAGDDGLGMAEDNSSLVASSTLDVHKVRVRGWHQSFELV